MQIVPEHSAKLLDYPTLPIHADHCDMCKFSSAEDGNYRIVAEILERWARELKGETKEEEKEEENKTVGPTSFLSESVTKLDIISVWEICFKPQVRGQQSGEPVWIRQGKRLNKLW